MINPGHSRGRLLFLGVAGGRHLCLLMLAIVAVLGSARAQDSSVVDQWAQARLEGQIVGYQHRTVVSHPFKNGLRYVTTEEELYKFKRGDQDLMIHVTSVSRETSEGVLIDFQKTTEQGGSPVVTRGYREGKFLVVWERGVETRYPWPEGFLAPYAADRKWGSQVLKPDSFSSCLVFLADFPQHPVQVDRRVIGREKHDTIKGPRELWKIRSNLDVMPGFNLLDWVDDTGDVQASSIPFGGFGDLELRACSKEEANQPIPGTELFQASQIIPDRALEHVRKLREATYRLSGPDHIAVFSGPNQTATTNPDGSVNVTVTAADDEPSSIGWSLPATITPELRPYLLSSTFLNLNDPGVQDLARQAVGSESNPLLAARKIESFVRTYIEHKDLSVGFGSASDTVKSRTGDCTEHAVLAAALGRVVGLPTRMVMGVGYLRRDADDESGVGRGFFGFHMWAEAYLGPDHWVAMDSALLGFDVGHIAFVKTDLATSADATQAFLPLLPLLGKLKISVLGMK